MKHQRIMGKGGSNIFRNGWKKKEKRVYKLQSGVRIASDFSKTNRQTKKLLRLKRTFTPRISCLVK